MMKVSENNNYQNNPTPSQRNGDNIEWICLDVIIIKDVLCF